MEPVGFPEYQLQPPVDIPQCDAGAFFAGCGRDMIFLVQGLVELLQCGGIHALSIVGYAYIDVLFRRHCLYGNDTLAGYVRKDVYKRQGRYSRGQ